MNQFIFSGMGFAPAKHIIENKQIEQAILKGFYKGFNHERVRSGDSYNAHLKSGGKLTPFEFLAEEKMGFRNRAHVVPFPPVKPAYKFAENSLDLAVKAVDEAINDAGISPDEIDAWIVGTATAHEMAPGTAETLKCYFVPYENQSQCMTLTSACVGFNINVERALNMMQNHPEMKHVVIAHTEVMSELLLEERDFVPATTFGDAAAAVILSRSESEKPEGIISIKNHEDLRMIDFLGAHKNGNLYMEPRIVKSRAVPNMIRVINNILQETAWENQYDLFIPHQTGHAIVHSVAEAVKVPKEKLIQDVQMKYGNLSGASVPASLYLLKKQGRLKPGMKVLTAVAGLGGEYGGFAYIVPEQKMPKQLKKRLLGKTIFVSGATGELASEVALRSLKEGANLLLHYRKAGSKFDDLKQKLSAWESQITYFQADLSKPEEVNSLIAKIKQETDAINYLLLSAANTGSLNRASDVSDEELKIVDQINHRANREICEQLQALITESVVIVGSVAEDALFSGSSAYVSSKRALHAFAIDFAQKMYRKNVRIVYYLPGIIDGGMTSKLNNPQIAMSMQSIGQQAIIPMDAIADRVFKSMFLPKVQGVQANYEGALMVRRDGYIKA
ncbi:MAG: SDR family NAD(P)-dependent oxidoreductase [Bacteroidales bacterium]|jgi:3-oxoacyl-[acyl-carrier-protein] synthase-3|nr:SDR family NAD(P)-dependent oxidoreductase [Bacteroidales bacterium]